ncbi:hypothetical protein BGX26_004449, partial [Mortierella sp. AD094]
MPFKSERQGLLDDLAAVSLFARVDLDEELEKDAMLIFNVVSSRFLGDRQKRQRKPHYFLNEFRAMFRTSRDGFTRVLNLIKDHTVFHNSSTCKQVDPAWQLAIALSRFGSNGNGASVSKTQAIFAIGSGTATLYTDRVITALLDLEKDWIKWPDTARRKEIGQVMRREGFPGCVG